MATHVMRNHFTALAAVIGLLSASWGFISRQSELVRLVLSLADFPQGPI